MYIESYMLVIAIIFIVYLLWRVYKLKNSTQQILALVDAYDANNTMLLKSILSIIVYDTAKRTAKMSGSAKQKYLLEVANSLRIAFYNNTLETFSVGNGKAMKIDDPASALTRVLNVPISHSEDYKEVNEAIAKALKINIDNLKK